MSAAFEEIVDKGLADYARSLAPDRRVVLDRYHYEDFARKVVGVGSVGWFTGATKARRQFYVRQLRDKKGSAEVEGMIPAYLATYGELCGATLARAHARTGDAAKITGYLGDDDTFDRALERFATAYADQNDADYAAFTEAADDQRIDVERGV